MQRPTHRLRLSEIGPHVKCVLCLGYLIDATTIVECLHSFCRSCLLNYLSNNNIFCPICDVQIHKTNPLLSIKPDKTLQDIVYKLVPGLFRSEMRQRRLFYAKHPQKSRLVSPEERGVGAERVIYSPDDTFSLSMEYYDAEREREERENSSSHSSESGNTDSTSATESAAAASPLKRYLQCPALVTIGILKKFIRMKFDLTCSHRVEVFHRRVSLANEYTLMDVAYIYTWKGSDPMRFFYRISEVSEPCVPPPTSPAPAELKTESPTAERALLAEPSTSKEPDAKPSTSTAPQPTPPKPPPTSSPGPKPSAAPPSSDCKPPVARAADSKPTLAKATGSDVKPSGSRTAAAEPKPAKAAESRASTSRACNREASKPPPKTRAGPESQPGKVGKGLANDKTPEATDRKPGNCVTAVEAAVKDRRPSRAASDSSDSGPVVDKKALFNSLKLKRCSEPVAVTTEKRREDAGASVVGFASSVKGAVPSTKVAALSTKDASPSMKGASLNTIGISPSAKGTVSNTMKATPSAKGASQSTIGTPPSVKVTTPNALDSSACAKGAVPKTINTPPSVKGAFPSAKEPMPSPPRMVPIVARAGHGSSAGSVPSLATSPAAKAGLPNPGTGTNKMASTSTTPTSLETAPTPTSSAVPGSNAAGLGAAAMGPTASLTAKKPHQQILTNNEEIIKTPVRRPTVPMTMPGEALKRKLAALEMSQRRPPVPAKKPRLALKLPGAPSTGKPGPALHKPGPAVQKPGPSIQKPCPAIQKPAPTIQKPGPAVQKPCPAVQKPGPAVQKPGPAVQKPGPAAQKPEPAVQKQAPGAQKPGPIPTKTAPGPGALEKPSPNAKAVLSPAPVKPSPPAGHKHMPASVPKPGQSSGSKASPIALPKQSVAEVPGTSGTAEKPSETAPRLQANEHKDGEKQRVSTNQRLEVEKPRATTNQPRPEMEKSRPSTNQPRPDGEKTRPITNQLRPEADKPRPSTNQHRADAEKIAAWANRQQVDVDKPQPSKSEKERPASVSLSPRLQPETKAKPAVEANVDRLLGGMAEKEPGPSEAGPSRLGKNHAVGKKPDEKVTSPLPQLIEIPKPRQDRTGALDLTARPAKCPRPAKPFAFPHPLKIPNLSRLPTPPPAKARRDEPTFPPAELSRVGSPLRDHRRGGVTTGAGPSGGRGLDEAAALRQRLEMQARLWGAGAAVPPEWFQMQDPSYVKHFETLMKSLASASPPSPNAAAAAAAAKKLNR